MPKKACADINPDHLVGEPCEPDHDLDLESFEHEDEEDDK